VLDHLIEVEKLVMGPQGDGASAAPASPARRRRAP